MDFFQAYHPEMDGTPTDLRHGKKPFPAKNLHYASNLGSAKAYYDYIGSIRNSRSNSHQTTAKEPARNDQSEYELRLKLQRTNEEIERLKKRLAEGGNMFNVGQAQVYTAKGLTDKRRFRAKSPIHNAAHNIFSNRTPFQTAFRPTFN